MACFRAILHEKFPISMEFHRALQRWRRKKCDKNYGSGAEPSPRLSGRVSSPTRHPWRLRLINPHVLNCYPTFMSARGSNDKVTKGKSDTRPSYRKLGDVTCSNRIVLVNHDDGDKIEMRTGEQCTAQLTRGQEWIMSRSCSNALHVTSWRDKITYWNRHKNTERRLKSTVLNGCNTAVAEETQLSQVVRKEATGLIREMDHQFDGPPMHHVYSGGT